MRATLWLIERSIRRAGVPNELMPFTSGADLELSPSARTVRGKSVRRPDMNGMAVLEKLSQSAYEALHRRRVDHDRGSVRDAAYVYVTKPVEYERLPTPSDSLECSLR